MKKWVIAAALALSGLSAQAEAAGPKVVRDYEDLLSQGALACKLDQDLYEASVRLHGAADRATEDDLRTCKTEIAARAQAGLAAAVQAADTQNLKAAVNNLYTMWQAYFGKFDDQGEDRFESAKGVVDTDLMASK